MVTAIKFTVTWSEAKKFENGNFDIDVDGVYLIGYRETQTNKRYVIYVGQGDVGSRLSDHHRSNACVKKKIAQPGHAGYYRYARCANEDDRLDIELGLYHNHGGTALCNEIEPSGSGRYQKIEVEERFS